MEDLCESAATQRLVQYLQGRGFRLVKPVKIRGRIPDVIALKNGETFLFEVKGGHGDILKGVAQALHYSHCANYSYLVAPQNALSNDVIVSARKLGIGVISIGPPVRESVAPKRKEGLESAKNAIMSVKRKAVRYDGPSKDDRKSLPLDGIFEFKSALRVLRLLCNNSHVSSDFSISEMSRDVGSDKATVSKTVAKLEKSGLIKSYYRGGVKLCRINEKHDVFDALAVLFIREQYLEHAEDGV